MSGAGLTFIIEAIRGSLFFQMKSAKVLNSLVRRGACMPRSKDLKGSQFPTLGAA